MKKSSTSILLPILLALTSGCTLIAPFDPHPRPDADTAPVDADHSDADSAQDADIDDTDDADIDDTDDADIDDTDDADIDDADIDDADIDDANDADIDAEVIDEPDNCIDEDGDGVFAGRDGATLHLVPDHPSQGQPLDLVLTASCLITDLEAKCTGSNGTEFTPTFMNGSGSESWCEFEFATNTLTSSDGTYTCVICSNAAGTDGCEVDPDHENVIACATIDVTPSVEK